MSELSLYARNFVQQTLAVGYTAGSGTITVPDGAAWGDPSPTLAIILTAFKANETNTPLFNAKVTGRTGDVLTIAAITWSTDQDLEPGDVVVNTPAAEYIEDVDVILAGKSNVGHTHDDRYYTESEVDTALAVKSDTGHVHDDRYYTEAEADTLLAAKSNVGHNHDERYYTESEIDTALAAKSDVGHIHDDRYYTETEVDTALANKSGIGHNHDNRYYTESEVDSALAGKSNIGHAHVIADVTGLQSSLDGKSAVGHIHDDRYYTESEVDAALAGKANTSHTHAASDITSGTIATARLGSGTSNAASFLRGDQTWVAPPGTTTTSPKSADFAVLTTENGYVYPVTAGSSGVVCTLPTASSAGDGFAITVYKEDSSKGNVTFAGAGAPSRVLYFKQDCITIRSDGTSWRVIGRQSLVAIDEQLWGDGSDGDVTISGGVSLTKDANYNTLTLASEGSLSASAYRILVRNWLDLSNAPANAISTTPGAGNNASGTNSSTGGSAVTTSANTIGAQYNTSVAGASGGTGAGAQARNLSATNIQNTISTNYACAQSGGGGSGSGGGGGALRATSNGAISNTFPRNPLREFYRHTSASALGFFGSNSGQAGSSGGGDGTNNGGGGGASGRGGAIIYIAARKIIRGASTAANSISANGSAGGNGGSPTTGNCGGGGGAGGGSGSGIYIVTGELIGTSAANALQAKGGNGGNGGTGFGTGANGTGGYAGPSGRIAILELSTGAFNEYTGSNVVANSGQTGGTAAEFQVSL